MNHLGHEELSVKVAMRVNPEIAYFDCFEGDLINLTNKKINKFLSQEEACLKVKEFISHHTGNRTLEDVKTHYVDLEIPDYKLFAPASQLGSDKSYYFIFLIDWDEEAGMFEIEYDGYY